VKLCFTSHRYAPQVGGYENQIRLLAENLSKYFPVKVVTFNLTGSPAAESINNVQVYRVKPQLVFFRVPFSTAYLKKLDSMDYDVLHAHGFVPVVSDISLTYAKSKKKTTVYTHHFDGNVQDTNTLNTLADTYNKTIARTSFHFADAIVSTTKSYAETSPALKPHLSRVQVIPCFVDCNQFKPQQAPQVERLKGQLRLNDKKTVLFVGRIVPYKGLEYLIKAVEHAKTELGEELNLLLVGGEEGKNITDKSEYYTQIRCLAEKSAVRENIHFLGRVENNQLSTYYSLADVVSLPSTMRGEAFGTVLLEALSCGTPVVASSIPGVKDVLKHNDSVGSYVPPKDSAELSQKLVKVSHRKKDITDHCRKFAFDNYRVEKIVNDYIELYSSLKR
jgi:glycosyltransferase involved in cell wall biosynthesis